MTLYPPSSCCSNVDCLHTKELKKAEQRQVVIYTLASSACPAWSVHLYCPDCCTNYHNNFKVCDGTRTYYQGSPAYLQVGEC
ncbi:uncharacterized protein LACBIDRAFT_319162 [Laccaria bicolor S238N-H82]|uniref:Predicted protein n=1 Tax=Laccaria bicolor (strain S238N-H82 / ATCC MYA-4686) TaxID=486041 RepID=B0D804_LACBS|nr:uncharacterized protein LACBIDRAFT_319162 [Laccaria bicolor S238N-H82]EDR09734.1 predicted protein [Laccaria bicolor S238N-H82]|eukprot:XP_001880083.1 predicted protein [Laccaria bicolor S238N-H82]